MNKDTSTVARVQLPSGELTLRSTVTRPDAYGPPLAVVVDAILLAGGSTTVVHSTDELHTALNRSGCSLIDVAASQAEPLAIIVSKLKGLGRVVTSPLLHSYLQNQFPVAVANNLPRMNGRELMFLTARLSLDSTPIELYSVRVELETLTITVTPIEPLT